MNRRILTHRLPLVLVAAGAFAALSVAHGMAPASRTHRSGTFAGVKVNGGNVTHSRERGANVLTLSSDFVVPDAPAPHWQVVDSHGNTYLLQRLKVQGATDGKGARSESVHQSIVVPAYVRDIAKVQIWCAFAETLLGEASFETPVK